MTIGGGLAINRAAQLEVADDGTWAQVKHFVNQLGEFDFVDFGGTKAFDANRYRASHADGIRQLHFKAIGQPSGDDVFGDIAGGIGGATIDLGRIFARECTTAVAGHATVGVDDDFAAGQAGITMRTTNNELTGGVDVHGGVLFHQVSRQYFGEDLFLDAFAQVALIDVGRVLRADDHRVNPHRLAVGVFDGDLALAVWSEEGHQTAFAGHGQFTGQAVGQADGQRHQFGGFVTGETDHHALVASPDGFDFGIGHFAIFGFEGLIDAHGDVG